MEIINEFFGERLVYALGWTILHSFWQCGLVALLLALILFCSNKASANFRYSLSFVALILCCAVSVKTFIDLYAQVQPLNLQTGDSETQRTLYVIYSDVNQHFPALKILENYLHFIVAFWVLGFLINTVFTLKQYRYSNVLKSRGTSNLPLNWQLKVIQLLTSMKLQRKIEVRLSELVNCPCVIGHLKPVVLLPVALINHMHREQVEMILLHEFAHIRRNDYLLSLLQRSIKVIFFFNPLLLWISSRIDVERENACDDEAVKYKGDPLAYAQTLKEFAMLHTNTTGMSFGTAKRSLLPRIQRLFERSMFSRKPLDGVFAVLVVTLGFLFVNAYASNQNETDVEFAYEFTSLPQARLDALFEEAKSTVNKKDSSDTLYFDLSHLNDYNQLSKGEQNLLMMMLGLSQSKAFSHLDFFQLKNQAALLQQARDPDKVKKDMKEILSLSQQNTNNTLAHIVLHKNSDLHEIHFSEEFNQLYANDNIHPIISSQRNYLIQVDSENTLAISLPKNNTNKGTPKEDIELLIDAIKESHKEGERGMRFTPPEHIPILHLIGVAVSGKIDNSQVQLQNYNYEDHMYLIEANDYVLAVIPQKAFFDAREHSRNQRSVGNFHFGLHWEENQAILYIDMGSANQTNDEMRKLISDDIFTPAIPDPELEADLAALEHPVETWLYTEQEFEYMREIIGELRGYKIGENEFSHSKQGMRKVDLFYLKDKSAKDFIKDRQQNEPRYFYGLSTPVDRVPTRVLVRAAKYETTPAQLLAMDKRNVPLAEILFEARKSCPDDDFVTELENPDKQAILIFSDLTCEHVKKLITELDSEAGKFGKS